MKNPTIKGINQREILWDFTSRYFFNLSMGSSRFFLPWKSKVSLPKPADPRGFSSEAQDHWVRVMYLFLWGYGFLLTIWQHTPQCCWDSPHLCFLLTLFFLEDLTIKKKASCKSWWTSTVIHHRDLTSGAFSVCTVDIWVEMLAGWTLFLSFLSPSPPNYLWQCLLIGRSKCSDGASVLPVWNVPFWANLPACACW